MRILVKLGGTLLDSVETRNRLAKELCDIQRGGAELIAVHGGGKQMTRFLNERGVESKFVRGLRVTTPEVIDAVLKVFAGTVNHELVAAFVAAGAGAVGLTGIDAGLTKAVQMDPELGFVGRPMSTDPALLDHLTAGGYLPVVACVAGDGAGNIYGSGWRWIRDLHRASSLLRCEHYAHNRGIVNSTHTHRLCNYRL